MRTYNIYYKNEKLNSAPLTEEEYEDIMKSKKYVIKKSFDHTGTLNVEKIPLKNVRTVKCVII